MTFLEGLAEAVGLKGWFSGGKRPMAEKQASQSQSAAEAAPQDPFFSDAAFENVIKDMESPDLAGFEQFANTHGVVIHRKPHGNSGLYEYKVIGYQPQMDAR